MIELKITGIGNSKGLILPREALKRLNVDKGDSLYLTEGPGGSYMVTANNPEFSGQMEAAERMIKQYRNTLSELAK